MTGPSDTPNADGRRGHERRGEDRPVAGEDRRTAERRSVPDRRSAPRR